MPNACLPRHVECMQGDGVVELEGGRRDSYHMLTGNWRNTEADGVVRRAGGGGGGGGRACG